jgi:hypothetical protein
MSVIFRKTKTRGPFRVSVSKRGVGLSVGVPGMRASIGADGRVRTTAGIPGSGLRSTKTWGGGKPKARPARKVEAEVQVQEVAEDHPDALKATKAEFASRCAACKGQIRKGQFISQLGDHWVHVQHTFPPGVDAEAVLAQLRKMWDASLPPAGIVRGAAAKGDAEWQARWSGSDSRRSDTRLRQVTWPRSGEQFALDPAAEELGSWARPAAVPVRQRSVRPS